VEEATLRKTRLVKVSCEEEPSAVAAIAEATSEAQVCGCGEIPGSGEEGAGVVERRELGMGAS
jgi:hypothetical protein